MVIIIAVCIIMLVLAYEIRHRMVTMQLSYLDNEVHRQGEEIKKLKEDVEKKQDKEVKKGFKLPFFP